MAEHKEPWNLSEEGMKNVIESLQHKLDNASYVLECVRPHTIISIDSYEHTVLQWALKEYEEKLKEKKNEKI